MCPEGLGDFCLYHGALGVPENDRAALVLGERGLQRAAGAPGGGRPRGEPGTALAVAKANNVKLRENIPTDEITALVRAAQVNVLPTFQATGIKLKLLLCLFARPPCGVQFAHGEGYRTGGSCAACTMIPEPCA
jgi:hypothetical protein